MESLDDALRVPTVLVRIAILVTVECNWISCRVNAELKAESG
jgi:hypothetical protein